jgi:biotin transport system permease protein
MLTLTSPIETPFHRVPAGLKLGALCALTLWLFTLNSLVPMGLALAIIIACYGAGGAVFLRHGAAMLWPLWPFVLIVGLWHLWRADSLGGAIVILRLITAMAAANLVTMTTGLAPMIQIVETLARPFAALLPPRRLALAMALVIRFVPVLQANATRLSEAWRARAPRPPRWRIIPALTLSAIDEADHVAEALRARGGVG